MLVGVTVIGIMQDRIRKFWKIKTRLCFFLHFGHLRLQLRPLSFPKKSPVENKNIFVLSRISVFNPTSFRFLLRQRGFSTLIPPQHIPRHRHGAASHHPYLSASSGASTAHSRHRHQIASQHPSCLSLHPTSFVRVISRAASLPLFLTNP